MVRTKIFVNESSISDLEKIMAQSRLEKVGTIYSKVRGFLASGAIKTEQVKV